MKQKAFTLGLLASSLASSQDLPPRAVANQTTVDEWFMKGYDDMFAMFHKQLNEANGLLTKALMRSSGSDIRRAEDNLNQLRRFKQLKEFVIWLQRVPKFGRYCYYGCW